MVKEKLLICFAVLLIFLAGCPQLPPAVSPPGQNQPVIIEEKWEGMQLKITYIGIQEKTVPSVGISVKKFDLSKFNGGTPGVSYTNDYQGLKTIEITESEMKNVVTNVFELDFIKEQKSSNKKTVSFMFYNATSAKVTEVLLDTDQTKLLVREIAASLDKSIANADPLIIYG
ncbi:hypothetical protein HY570_00710 [Candidatus Micrarchaeota archaeon]|nr:hypothetical protein [Candidatus Micrarchaeota archaeon]